MVWVRRVLVFALAFGLGVVLGPLLSAVIAGFYPVNDKTVPLAGAMRLLDAYEARVPAVAQPAAGMSWSAAARRCGYDPREVMEIEVPAGAEWTPYLGYFDLRMWQGSEARADLRAGQATRLATALTPFQQGFYRECLAASAFAPMCQQRVAEALAQAPTEPRVQTAMSAAPAARSRETICHFLDGVVARRGRPLALREGVTPVLPDGEAPVAAGP
jgi:hypothetical protein